MLCFRKRIFERLLFMMPALAVGLGVVGSSSRPVRKPKLKPSAMGSAAEYN
jgi:hypothetical protein